MKKYLTMTNQARTNQAVQLHPATLDEAKWAAIKQFHVMIEEDENGGWFVFLSPGRIEGKIDREVDNAIIDHLTEAGILPMSWTPKMKLYATGRTQKGDSAEDAELVREIRSEYAKAVVSAAREIRGTVSEDDLDPIARRLAGIRGYKTSAQDGWAVVETPTRLLRVKQRAEKSVDNFGTGYHASLHGYEVWEK